MTDMTMVEMMAEAIASVDEDEFAVRHGRTTDQYEVVRVTDPDGSANDDGLAVLFWGEREACEHVAEELLHLARARAALRAMREPNSAMLAVGLDHGMAGTTTLMVRGQYVDMIDAALSEGTSHE